MSTAHKNLTGTDLHEPKGIAGQTAGKVYVSDGANSGTWKKVTSAELDPTGNPFGAALLHVREEQSSGVSSSSATTTSSWVTEVLNTTKTNEITGSSVSSNQISLPAGTYFVEAMFINGGALINRGRIQNITDGTTLVLGPNQETVPGTGGGICIQNTLKGRFTLAGTKAVEFQHFVSGAFKHAQGASGVNEVYNDVLIWKIA